MERRSSGAAESPMQAWWWILDPRYSLRARAAYIFAGGSLLFLVLMSWFAGRILQQSLERQVGSSLEVLAQQVSDKIDRAIYERLHGLLFTAKLAAFRSPASDKDAAAHRRALLEALQKESPDFGWIGFADGEGNLTSATNGWLEGSSAAMRSWFRAAQEHAHIGRLQELPDLAQRITGTDDEHAARFLDLAAPVSDDNGNVIGVIGAYLRWEWTRDVAFSVITESAQQRRIGVTVYSGNTDVILDSGASGWTFPPNAPSLASARPYRGSQIEHSGLGTDYVTGYVRSRGFRDYRGLGWLVTVRQPADRAFAPVGELQWLILGWGCGFAAIGVVVCWIVTGRVAHRLRSVTAAADRVREGDILAVLPRPPGRTEVSRMCDSLHELVEDLRTKEDTLTARNAQLEAEARERESSRR